MLKKILIVIGTLGIALVCLLFGGLYFFQEKLIFHPKKLAANYSFNNGDHFTEMYFPASDGVKLHGGYFTTTDSSKGLIFYLHGNGGALDTWSDIAPIYTSLGYGILLLDYRGYGKSEGEINNEEQFHSDIQMVYDSMKTRYPENKIIVEGYSIGTGPASLLSARNRPKMLILQAPYYSLSDMSKQEYPVAPGFLLRYQFKTFEGIENCKAPIVVFHGDADQLIHYEQSEKLAKHFKPGDKLVRLPGQEHGHVNQNAVFQKELKQILGS